MWKKILSIAILAFGIAAARPAHAGSAATIGVASEGVSVATSAYGATLGTCLGSTLAFTGAAAFGAIAVVLIANNVDPWTPIFPVVTYQYPADRNGV